MSTATGAARRSLRCRGKQIVRYGLGADSLGALTMCLAVILVEADTYSRNEYGYFETKLGTSPELFEHMRAPAGN